MNVVVLSGRLTDAPRVRYTADNKAIANFTLAVDYSKDETAFINCVAFGRNGEFAEKYLHKGTKILVEGRIQTGSYTNKDGQKVYTTDVVLDDIEFAESKNAQGGRSQGGYDRPQQPSGADNGFMSIPDSIDEELPFA